MPTVFIVNRSAHNYSKATEFGPLDYLSDGPMGRYEVNNIHRVFWEKLQHSQPDDLIVPCGLTIMSCIACAIMASLHGRINVLLYNRGKYMERNIILKEDH